jgi:peptidoglycan/LPS O-acetylase OafA/YrhL
MRARNQQLDLLRCAAILGVLVAHTTIFRPPRRWWDQLVARPSWTGVDLFFVISGFLISGLLFSEYQKYGRIQFGRFAIRRALKLYPMLYVLVFGVLGFRLLQSGFHGIRRLAIPAIHDVFFLQSYLPGTYGHFWSIAVEEHFYILLPLMLYVMIRRARSGEENPFQKLPLVFLLVAIFSLVERLIHAVLVPSYNVLIHLVPTHFRMDSLFFGVLLSYWHYFYPDEFSKWIKKTRLFLLPISLLLILPAVLLEQRDFFIYTVGLTLLYLGYGGLLISFVQVSMPANGLLARAVRPLAYIGRHSYPIYLFHIMVMEELIRRDLQNGRRGMALYFTLTISIGILLSKLIEFPVLRLRDRLFPPRAVIRASVI